MSDAQIYVIQHYEPRDLPRFYYREFTAEEIEEFKEPEHTGYHKIGYATNPKKRLSILRGGTPHSLRIVTTIDVEGEVRQVERELHNFYGNVMDDRGEWFRVPVDHIHDLKEIDTLRPGVIGQVCERAIKAGDLSVSQPREIDLLAEVKRARVEQLNGSGA